MLHWLDRRLYSISQNCMLCVVIMLFGVPFYCFQVVCWKCCNWLHFEEKETRELPQARQMFTVFLPTDKCILGVFFATSFARSKGNCHTTDKCALGVIFFWWVLLLDCTEPRKLSQISQENKNYIPLADPFAAWQELLSLQRWIFLLKQEPMAPALFFFLVQL